MKIIVSAIYTCRFSVIGDDYTSSVQRPFVLNVPADIADKSDDVYDKYLFRLVESAIKSRIAEVIPYDTIEVTILSIDDFKYIEVG